MTFCGLRIARPKTLFAVVAVAVVAIVAVAVTTGRTSEKTDLMPTGSSESARPPTDAERTSTLELIQAAASERGIEGKYTTAGDRVWNELGIQGYSVSITFDAPTDGTGPWMTRVCDGTRLVESFYPAPGVRRFEVEVHLKDRRIMQFIPETEQPLPEAGTTPAAESLADPFVRAVNNARNAKDVPYRVLDPKTGEEIEAGRLASGSDDLSGLCPPGTTGTRS